MKELSCLRGEADGSDVNERERENDDVGILRST